MANLQLDLVMGRR